MSSIIVQKLYERLLTIYLEPSYFELKTKFFEQFGTSQKK